MKNIFLTSFVRFIIAAMPIFVSCSNDDVEMENNQQNTKQEESDTIPKLSGYKECPDENHPHMIDLGLPSGTLWACCNVGSSAPWKFGSYYAWGEIQPKQYYVPETYRYAILEEVDVKVSPTERNYIYTNIGSDIAGTEYDAVTANWDKPWHMPTYDQFQELENNCSWEWLFMCLENGFKVTGPNGGFIFFPAAGVYLNNRLIGDNVVGYYWLSSLSVSAQQLAYSICFNEENVHNTLGYNRYSGLPIRPVCNN